MLASNCCDALPWNCMVDEIDDMYMGICSACGEHAVFYEEDDDEE